MATSSPARLVEGFWLDGQRVPFMGPQGIFKPAVMTAPLSMTTVPSGPYDDRFDEGGVLHYRYRGQDPFHRHHRAGGAVAGR